MLRDRKRPGLINRGGSDWYRSGALALNGIFPSYISQFKNNRYYNTTTGLTSMPFTITRAGNATMFDSSGRLVWANANMILHSDDLTNAAWTKTDSTITANVETAPSGASADLITEGSAGTALVNQTVASMPAFGHFVYTTEVKRGNTDWLRIYIGTGGNTVQSWFNLATGTVGITTTAGSPVQNLAARMVATSGGYYNCSISIGNVNITSVTVETSSAASDGSTTRVSGATRIEGRHKLEMYGVDSPKLPMLQTTSAAAYDLRYTYDNVTAASLGLWLEPQRTNSLPNAWFNNASIGSTAPTGCVFAASSGITITCTGIGFEDGMRYIDLTWSGTATATVTCSMQFCLSNQIAAASGQTWAAGVFVRRIEANPDAKSVALQLLPRNAATTPLPTVGAITLTNLNATSIGKNWQTTSATLTDATTAFICSRITKTYLNTEVAQDTLRIALPQLEGSSITQITSPIPTFNTAAITRAGEAVSSLTGLGSFFSDGFSVYAEYESLGSKAGNPPVWVIGDGIASGDEATILEAVTVNPTLEVKDAGVAQASIATGTGSRLTAYKVAGLIKTNDVRAVKNGGAVTTDTVATFPVVDQMSIGSGAARGGSTTVDSSMIIGEIRIYPPASASDAQYQALTS